jgi:hypothetical protein
MAAFNNHPTQNIGADLTPVYQATVKTIVVGCLLTNKGAGFLPVKLMHRTAAGVDTAVAPCESVRGGKAFDATAGKKVVLLAGEQLLASCPVAGSIDALVSVLEGVA